MSAIRISASRLKTLWDCSLKFWYQEIIRLPSSSHPKTRVGSLTHLVFEVVMHPRRRAMFRRIMQTETFCVADYPVLVRFIKWQLKRWDLVGMATVEDIEELLHVAWVGIRPHFTTRVKWEGDIEVLCYTPPDVFINEHRFQITLSSGAVISGFLDLVLLWGKVVDGVFVAERVVVVDLKTQAEKFSRKELPSNVQAAMYQMVVEREHGGLIPAVEFIMLRHAPTKRHPQLHIQRVEPPSGGALRGLEEFIDHTYVRVNGFSMEDAFTHACTDSRHCEHKCSFLRPFTYWVLCAQGDPIGENPLEGHLSLDAATEALHNGPIGGHLIERRHKGCALRWNPNQTTFR